MTTHVLRVILEPLTLAMPKSLLVTLSSACTTLHPTGYTSAAPTSLPSVLRIQQILYCMRPFHVLFPLSGMLFFQLFA